MRHSRGGAMVDVASRGGARGRPRDAPVALELDERPLVPVHLQQHRVPDSHRGRGLDPRERRWRWRARKSAQFRHVRRRIGGGIGPRARTGGGRGLVFRGWRAEGRRGRRGRGTADGARGTNDFLTRSLSPRQRQQQRSARQTRLVLPRFSKAASAAGPVPRCPRLIAPGRAPRGATPSTSSATRARGTGSRREATGANEETRPSRVRGRRRRRLGRRLGRLGRWWNIRDRPRRRPPRRAPSTGPDAAKGTARSRARSSWRWSARLERSGKRTRGM